MLDERPVDYDAHNAVLWLTLGLLGWRERLHAVLAEAAPGRPVPARPGDAPTEHALLGLIAVLERVHAHAASTPLPPPPAARPEPAPVVDLLR